MLYFYIVHGNWTTWSDWGTCSVTCGSGIRVRKRECTNPEPQHGGDECPGVDVEFEDCEAGKLCAGIAPLSRDIWSVVSDKALLRNRRRPVVRKVDNAIQRKVIFSTIVKMLEKL